MKVLFASDIHGSEKYCSDLLKRMEQEEVERLVLLGDLLYHGPRNDLPLGYAPKKVIELLNEKKEQIICVRGNCEAEVDQMVLDFPVMADYAILYLDGFQFFLTHGHKFNMQQLPPVQKNTILTHGHTHLYAIEKTKFGYFFNPGSISLAKNGNVNSYGIYDNGSLMLKNMEGEIITDCKLVLEP